MATLLLSITPVQALHNLLANHQDTAAKKGRSGHQLAVAGYHCDTGTSVATSPFTDYISVFTIAAPLQMPAIYAEQVSGSYFSIPYHTVLRGPPAGC